MANQTLRPTADLPGGSWATDDGDLTGLYSAISETVPDEASYVISPDSAGVHVQGFDLPDLDVGELGVVSLSYLAGGGIGGDPMVLVAELYKDGSPVAGDTQLDLDSDWATYTLTLDDDQKTLLGDGTGLTLYLTAAKMESVLTTEGDEPLFTESGSVLLMGT